MTKSQKLAIISKVQELKAEMKNCYFWTPKQSASERRKYEKYKSVGNVKIDGVDVYANCECSCKNIYFNATHANDLKKIEIKLRYSKLTELSKKYAAKRFKKYKNPNGYSFQTVWEHIN